MFLFMPSKHLMACQVTSCHVMSCHVASYHAMHVISCHASPCHALSCHATPCHVVSCHPRHAMPATSCRCCAAACHVTSCHVAPCHAIHVISRHATSCHGMSCASHRVISCETHKHKHSPTPAQPSLYLAALPAAVARHPLSAGGPGGPRRAAEFRGPLAKAGVPHHSSWLPSADCCVLEEFVPPDFPHKLFVCFYFFLIFTEQMELVKWYHICLFASHPHVHRQSRTRPYQRPSCTTWRRTQSLPRPLKTTSVPWLKEGEHMHRVVFYGCFFSISLLKCFAMFLLHKKKTAHGHLQFFSPLKTL